MSVFSLKIDIADNKFFNGETSPLFSQSQAKLARQFHQKIAGYRPTPLCALDDLANLFGVKKILVKDESKRFGLNAFKMLGGAYAIAQLLCEKYHLDIETLSFEHLKNAIGEKMTFATTTDGNHGRGVAWAAQQLGQNAVIYMPKGSAQERVDAILNLGAECIVTDMNYDDTVRLTMQHAQQHGWEVVQDTAWEGYTKIPTWIMQGYATLADEAVEQMREMGVTPTHVLLQAGVGAMAGGVPVVCWVIWSTSIARKICTALLLNLTKLTVFIAPASKATSSTLAVIWPPSWQAWPVANLTRWAGKSYVTAPPNSSPARTALPH